MKILNYLEAHQLIEQTSRKSNLKLSNQTRTHILRLSGRLDLWLPPLIKLLGKSAKTTNQQALDWLTSQHLLEPVFEEIPTQEYLYLLPPATPPKASWLVRHGYHDGTRLFSPLFTTWLQRQGVLETHLLTHTPLTQSESKLLAYLFTNQQSLVSRDELAAALWGDNWYESYSDWTIDTNIHNLRSKLLPHWHLVTVRNRGYILRSTRSLATKSISAQASTPIRQQDSILPTKEYLNYMNNPYNNRKVYADLFSALNNEKLPLTTLLPSSSPSILCVNSYSFDNVDALAKQFPESTAHFTGIDQRALKIHQTRINELGLDNWHTLYDDIRESRLQDASFELAINDFRLNWNLNHQQNLNALKETRRVLKDKGLLLLSTVVDARYESSKYGDNQEKAPLNLHKPWHFQAEEGLERLCHTVPYYKKLIQDSGFQLVQEFDLDGGKAWTLGVDFVDPKTRPSYRRFLLRK